MAEGYADSGHMFSVEFDRKVIVYWWLVAMGGMAVSIIGIPLAILWLLLGWIVHKKQFEKQQNIPLDKLTDVSIHEGPILNFFGVVRMQFETAAPNHSCSLE